MSNKNVFTWEELMNLKITNEPFLVNPILPLTGVAMLYGPSDSGKSFLCKQLSVAIANGEHKFLDFDINAKHQKVLYVSTEEIDHASLARKAQMQSKSFSCNNPSNIKVLIELKEPMKAIEELLQIEQFDLVIIDGWADTVQGDTNQVHIIRKSMLKYRELAFKNSCCFLLIHHSNKAGEDNQANKKYLSGSHAIENVVRSLFELRKGNDKHRQLTILKGNDIADSYKEGFYLLEADVNMIYESKGYSNKGGFAGAMKKQKYFDDDEIREAALALRKEEKTYEEIHQLLKDTFPDKSPGLTTIKNWFREEGEKILEEKKEESK